MVEIDQIGALMAADIIAFFSNEANRDMVIDLASELSISPPDRPADDSPISGKTIVFTGTLSGMSRAEAKARAKRLGQRLQVRSRQRPTFSSQALTPGRRREKPLIWALRCYPKTNGWQ